MLKPVELKDDGRMAEGRPTFYARILSEQKTSYRDSGMNPLRTRVLSG